MSNVATKNITEGNYKIKCDVEIQAHIDEGDYSYEETTDGDLFVGAYLSTYNDIRSWESVHKTAYYPELYHSVKFNIVKKIHN